MVHDVSAQRPDFFWSFVDVAINRSIAPDEDGTRLQLSCRCVLKEGLLLSIWMIEIDWNMGSCYGLYLCIRVSRLSCWSESAQGLVDSDLLLSQVNVTLFPVKHITKSLCCINPNFQAFSEYEQKKNPLWDENHWFVVCGLKPIFFSLLAAILFPNSNNSDNSLHQGDGRKTVKDSQDMSDYI